MVLATCTIQGIVSLAHTLFNLLSNYLEKRWAQRNINKHTDDATNCHHLWRFSAYISRGFVQVKRALLDAVPVVLLPVASVDSC